MRRQRFRCGDSCFAVPTLMPTDVTIFDCAGVGAVAAMSVKGWSSVCCAGKQL